MDPDQPRQVQLEGSLQQVNHHAQSSVLQKQAASMMQPMPFHFY
jgi:hypothetical protein